VNRSVPGWDFWNTRPPGVNVEKCSQFIHLEHRASWGE